MKAANIGDVTLGQIFLTISSVPRAVVRMGSRMGEALGVKVLSGVDELDALDNSILRMLEQRNTLATQLSAERKVSRTRCDWRIIGEGV